MVARLPLPPHQNEKARRFNGRNRRGLCVEAAMNEQSAGPLGRVLSVTGSQAQVRLAVAGERRARDRRQIPRHPRRRRARGRRHHQDRARCASARGEFATCALDMLGEIKDGDKGPFFQRGVTEYPMIGDAVEPDHAARAAADLRHVRPRHDRHRHAAAGRLDPGLHQCRRHGAQAFRGVRHHRRRQVERRRAAVAPDPRGAAATCACS